MFDLRFWTVCLLFTYVFASTFGITPHLTAIASLTVLFHSGFLGEETDCHH